MKEGIKKKFCVTYYVNKVHMYRETYEIEDMQKKDYIIKNCEKLQQNIIPIIESIDI